MNDELRVRPFLIEDAERVVELLQDVSVFNLNSSEARRSAESFLQQSGAYACVVSKGPQVIGFGSLFAFSRVRGGRSAVIEDMVVGKAFRGKGIGKLILNELLKYAQSEACFKVSLESSDGARSFYQTAGFKPGGQVMKMVL